MINSLTKAERARQQMTLQQFGDALGVSRQAVHQWESGDNIPDYGRLLVIVETCGDWRKRWAQACISAHPYMEEYQETLKGQE